MHFLIAGWRKSARLFVPFVSTRYLRARQQEKMVSVIATLSFLGIMLGVATLIIVTAVMNGFHSELLGRILGLNGHLRVFHTQAHPIAHYEKIVTDLRKNPLVISAQPIIDQQALVTVPSGAAAVVVHGIQLTDMEKRPLLKDNIKAGHWPEKWEEDEIVIGKRLAEKLGVFPGSRITVLVPQGSSTVFGSTPRTKTFTIRAVFEVGMIDYDSAYVFVPLQTAQALFRIPGEVSNIDIFTKDLRFASQITPSMLEVLPPGLALLDWQQANTGYFEAIKVEKNVMFLILTLIIIVAAFNVISSLIMLVKDKSVDIAILRTIGASKGMVLRIFLNIGARIGALGALLGGGLGILIASNIESIRKALEKMTKTNLFQAEIYFLTRLPAELNFIEVGVIVLLAMTLSWLAAFYPAWRASRLNPIEALRQA